MSEETKKRKYAPPELVKYQDLASSTRQVSPTNTATYNSPDCVLDGYCTVRDFPGIDNCQGTP